MLKFTVSVWDTVDSIAARFDVPLADLMIENGLKTPMDLKAGMTLSIPSSRDLAPPTPYQGARDGPAAGARAPQAAPAAAAIRLPEVSARQYTVRPGDTLYGIAQAHGLTMHVLMADNGITDPQAIREGQTLRIPERAPGSSLYIVRLEDTLETIASRHGSQADDLAAMNRWPRERSLYPGQLLIVPPRR